MERKTPQKKRLVGNDIVSLSRQKPASVKRLAKQPKVISEITRPKRKLSPIKTLSLNQKAKAADPSLTTSFITSETTTDYDDIEHIQRQFNQALVNAIAYDTLIIVVLAYVGFISKWLLWFIIAYAVVVLIFRFSSRRMFISAAFSIVLLIVLRFLHRNVLESAFVELSLFYIVIGIIRFGDERIKK